MFRFTIRDVLWLTVVVALGLGWWLSDRSNRAEIAELRKEAITHYLGAQTATACFYNLTKQYEKAMPGSVERQDKGHVVIRIGDKDFVHYDLGSEYGQYTPVK